MNDDSDLDSIPPIATIDVTPYVPPEFHPNSPWDLRFTDTEDSIHSDKVIEFLNNNFDYFLGGEENADNHHWHIVFWSKESYDSRKQKEKFRDLLYDFFKPPENKKGNPTYRLKPVKEITKAIPYALKDGEYFFTDSLEELVEEAYALSFQKPKGFQKDLTALVDRYISDNLTDIELWNAYADLKDLYEHNKLNQNDARDFLIFCRRKRKPETWEKLFYCLQL